MNEEHSDRRRARIIVSSCKGCHDCIGICPTESISFSDFGIRVDDTKCTGCGICLNVCRFDAIII